MADRPLDAVYPVLFIDVIDVKIRDGHGRQPADLRGAGGSTVTGTRDILGLWAGEHGDGEGAKYWLRVLSEIKNRGVADVCLVVCDGLKGLPEAIATVWPAAITQTCVVHLLRNSFRYAIEAGLVGDRQGSQAGLHRAVGAGRDGGVPDLRRTWEQRYPAIIKLWENAWPEFVPFLRFDTEIRTVVCTTDEIVNSGAAADGVVLHRHCGLMQLPETGGPQPWSRWSARLDERP